MRLKLIVMQKDHTNKVYKPRKKHRTSDNVVNIKDQTFFLDDDYFQITTERFGVFFKKRYITYYYAASKAKPLPVPNFGIKAKPDDISRDELNAIFNPWFYRVISAKAMSPMERIQFMATVGTLLVSLYLVYVVSGLPDQIVDAIAHCMRTAESACHTAPVTP